MDSLLKLLGLRCKHKRVSDPTYRVSRTEKRGVFVTCLDCKEEISICEHGGEW